MVHAITMPSSYNSRFLNKVPVDSGRSFILGIWLILIRHMICSRHIYKHLLCINLILLTTLAGSYYNYNLHFIDEKTEG